LATPKAIIKRALRLTGALGIGETPEAAVIEDSREALNAMLDSWNAGEKLAVYAVSRSTKVLTPSDGDYSIGSGGDINVTQPVKLDRASVIRSGDTLESPIRVLTDLEWADVANKSTAGTVWAVHFAKGITNARGTIHVLDVPSAADTLALYLNSQFAQIAAADVDTDYALPPGALDAIVYNLALRLAPEDGKPISAEVAATAQETKANYKRSNLQPVDMDTDCALTYGAVPNITSGDF